MKEAYIRATIAALGLIICGILLAKGFDGEIKAIFGFILGYYFHSTEKVIKIVKENARKN